jgi:hypothetical protein
MYVISCGQVEAQRKGWQVVFPQELKARDDIPLFLEDKK